MENQLFSLIEKNPENIDNRMSLAKYYIEKQDYPKAKNVLLEILSLDSANLDANYVLSQIYEFEENFSDSAKCLEPVVLKNSTPDLNYKLGQLYENAEDYEKALIFYKNCYEKNNDDVDVIERMAHINRIMGNKQDSIDFYQKLLKKDDKNIIALTQLVDLYEEEDKLLYYITKAKLQEIEEQLSHAVSSYKKALTKADHPEDIIKIRLLIANIYEKKEDYIAIIDEYIAILAMDSSNSNIYKKLGDTYLKLDNLEAAYGAYEQYLNINSDDVEVMEALSEILIDLDESEKALSYLDKLINLNSSKLE